MSEEQRLDNKLAELTDQLLMGKAVRDDELQAELDMVKNLQTLFAGTVENSTRQKITRNISAEWDRQQLTSRRQSNILPFGLRRGQAMALAAAFTVILVGVILASTGGSSSGDTVGTTSGGLDAELLVVFALLLVGVGGFYFWQRNK